MFVFGRKKGVVGVGSTGWRAMVVWSMLKLFGTRPARWDPQHAMPYFDHNATTPPAPEACRAMADACVRVWGNPSSPHWAGQAARMLIEEARAAVAGLFCVGAADVVFTSGGTEAACQVLLGGEALYRPRHLIVSPVEHACVLSSAEALEAAGWRVTRLRVDGQGRVDPADVRQAIAPDTALISVMTANNDTGVLQPLAEIADVARSAAVPFHSDAVQAAGRLALDLNRIGVDFATISGHKLYGPKGSGAVICGSRRRPGALLRGGEQEGGLRAGTEDVPAIAGLGAAAALARRRWAQEAARLATLRDRLEAWLCENCADAVVHGAGAERLPNTLNIAFPGVRAAALAARLDLEGVAVATTSACASKTEHPPHVLLAMGVPPELALASVRFSLGEGNTLEEVEEAAGLVIRLLTELRRA